MARSTNGPASRKRRKKVLKYAKGYFGSKSKLFRYAKEAVQHAWQYAYRDRKKKKAEWRGLWIVRLNASCREAGINPLGCAVPTLLQFPIWIGLYQSILLALATTPDALISLSKHLYPWITKQSVYKLV